MKTGIYPEDIVVAYAARALKRPVQLAGRAQRGVPLRGRTAATSTSQRRARARRRRQGAGAARALARQRRRLRDAGRRRDPAADRAVGVDQHLRHRRRSTCTSRAVLTNTAPTGAYRGAGRPEAIYIIERLMDAAAREMKLDPAELRRRNMIRPEQMPYTNPMAQTYDSGRFEQILDQGLALADWNGFAARRARVEARAASCAAAASRPSSNGPAATCSRSSVDVDVARRRHHRDLLGDAGDGPGHRDQLCAARGRRVRRADREDPHRAGRHRPRQRLRQRRLALAVHRRLGGARRVASARSTHAQGRSPARRSRRRRPTSNTAPGASASPAPIVGIDLFELAAQAAGARASSSTRPATVGGADLAERLPRLRSRDRSRHRRRRRSSPTRRSTTSAASSTR